MSDTNENCTYGYDYENKCDCREDDNCGCTFPNNMPHDFDCRCGDEDENFSCEDNDDADCCECENLICDTLHCQNLIVENLELPARPDFKGESMLPRYHLDLNMGMPYPSR